MSFPDRRQQHLDLLTDLMARAKRAGADAADAIMVQGASLNISFRLGKLEDVERSEGQDLGIRVLVGRRQAFVSTTDLSSAALDATVARVVAMAKAAPEDPYCGLADRDLLAKRWPDLDLRDHVEPTTEDLVARAKAAEEAALAVKGVTNSEGAGADWSVGLVALATSEGFAGAYIGSHHGVSASVIAGEGTGMERDYDYASVRHLSELASPEEVGRSAGEKAVARLNPRKMPSQAVPIVFDPRVAGSMLGHLAGAVTGPAVARGTSFLKDRLHKPVFAPGIQVIDDPHRKRGLRSKPFDGEGVATQRTVLIDNGELTTWLLDSASARQLKLKSTGHAARGTGGPPSPSTTNLYLAPGKQSPDEMMADIKHGLYVTEIIGFGVNAVTGDYSRGAAGFWIENGELAYPVSELTIAGNLKDMFARLTPASDLTFRYGTDSPTVRIEGMTVAGT
ncbi:TldD/PmbA family protein [Desertibaculum subflavum]|uniref:TldD/PmbA family protein n=1 Tax=Desertibaculum subflavum TaxID=2268458 RepID=UPI000E6738B8